MNWNAQVSVIEYWVPNEKKLNKKGEPTFFRNVVRKITLKSNKSAVFLVKRDTIETKHMQITVFRGKFNVSAIVEKPVPVYDRYPNMVIPTKNYTIKKFDTPQQLVKWLAFYLKDETTAEYAVLHMLNDEPIKKAA